jgi:hypothetical protein
MASFFDEDSTTPELPGDEFAEVEALDKDKAPEVAQKQEVEQLPEKYRNKSIEDVIKMHQNAEQLMSRQAEEVAFARKMAEQAAARLQSSNGNEAQRTSEAVKETEVDFFVDPKTAVDRAVENHPKVRQASEAAEVQRRREAQERVLAAQINPQELMAEPEFKEFVTANPKRLRLLQEADQWDADAAIELFSSYQNDKKAKMNQEAVAQATQIKTQQQQARKAGEVDAGVASITPSGGKIYRRADLIRLHQTDPTRYEALQDEILLAYAQGRVK